MRFPVLKLLQPTGSEALINWFSFGGTEVLRALAGRLGRGDRGGGWGEGLCGRGLAVQAAVHGLQCAWPCLGPCLWHWPCLRPRLWPCPCLCAAVSHGAQLGLRGGRQLCPATGGGFIESSGWGLQGTWRPEGRWRGVGLADVVLPSQGPSGPDGDCVRNVGEERADCTDCVVPCGLRDRASDSTFPRLPCSGGRGRVGHDHGGPRRHVEMFVLLVPRPPQSLRVNVRVPVVPSHPGDGPLRLRPLLDGGSPLALGSVSGIALAELGGAEPVVHGHTDGPGPQLAPGRSQLDFGRADVGPVDHQCGSLDLRLAGR